MIIALIGQKGGSGKSTTAINLAAEWKARGEAVLLVDADPQGTARTWGELAVRGDPASAPTVVAMGAEMHRPGQLPTMAAAFAMTLIDAPPRHDSVQRSALMVADFAVLPCGPTAMDAWALAESLELVGQARAIRAELNAAVLITRKVARTALGSSAREALADCGLPVLASELGYRVAFQEAPALGQGVCQYAPRSAAAVELRALVDELQQQTMATSIKAPQEATDAAA